jgi:hypothetical protein
MQYTNPVVWLVLQVFILIVCHLPLYCINVPLSFCMFLGKWLSKCSYFCVTFTQRLLTKLLNWRCILGWHWTYANPSLVLQMLGWQACDTMTSKYSDFIFPISHAIGSVPMILENTKHVFKEELGSRFCDFLLHFSFLLYVFAC